MVWLCTLCTLAQGGLQLWYHKTNASTSLVIKAKRSFIMCKVTNSTAA